MLLIPRLALFNKEEKGWQDKSDSMQHKFSAAERLGRCLDHLACHKLESRQELEPNYGSQNEESLLRTDIIGVMLAMSEEIYETYVYSLIC